MAGLCFVDKIFFFKIITTRNYKLVDTKALQQDMENAPWSVINIFDDIDDAEYAFNILYNNIIKAHIPERKVKVRSNSLPWITSDIRKLMNKRYKLLEQAKRTQSEDLWREYKNARNEVTHQLRLAEALYWKNEFGKTQNSRDFWNLVKKVKRQERKQNTIGPIRDDQDNIILEDSAKATLMNDYFSTIGEYLMANLQPTQDHSSMHHIYRISPTFPELTLHHSMLLKDISIINPRKATGPDCVSPRDLKLCGESIIRGLQPLFKSSLAQSRIPSLWKTSRMHTVFKKGDSTDKSNYRPLQMLSIPSKILEATVCRNIDSFISENGLSNENQWGFIKGRSTEGLLTHLTEKWKIALDNGNVVGVVYIDFKKHLTMSRTQYSI